MPSILQISIDFFTAFGWYSLFSLLISVFIKKTVLHKLDEEAQKFISLVGIIYFVVWIIGTFIFYFESSAEEKNMLLNRIFGKYWFGFWLQAILWFSISQLLRVRKIWKNLLLRILFSMLLIVSIEKYVIVLTSFKQGNLSSIWSLNDGLGIFLLNFVLVLLVKIIFFLLFVGIFYFLKSKIKDFKTKK